MKLYCALAALAIAGSAVTARADAPVPAPSVVEVSSPNGLFRAVADPKKALISIFKRGETAPIWSLPGWHRSFFLANDGEHFIIGPDGLNLLPASVREDDPLLVFMRRTETVRVITVGQLFPGLRGLQRTVSHLAWGSILGVSAQDQLIVKLADGRRLAFNASSGELEKEKQSSKGC